MVGENEHRVPTLNFVEPQTCLLTLPPSGQLLYKIMRTEDLLSSIKESYLYFTRVDSYKDFPSISNSDANDGEQLPKDRPGNQASKFKADPDISAENYYDHYRSRTYACCFSLEETEYIWHEYANENKQGKVCVVFSFDKLREVINNMLIKNNSL